ncbi:MAG: protein-L-isoaspartate(D-aspartate) O-methyltransferase [Desulfobacterales bacterium]|nr:protein-L-isoaspartate(D-aspartate) O-methyltransferase [Desulfobacterales bacterium]
MKRICLLIFLLFLPDLILADIIEDSPQFRLAREKMVADQIRARGITDPQTLAAMTEVPRHHFVPKSLQHQAYADRPLPIGEGQTISQPYVVALMTEGLKLSEDARVLEIGTGSGYQAAVLSRIVKEVYSIEIKENIFNQANRILQSLPYTNIKSRLGDGYFGWKDAAPFDAIMITAAIDHIPPPLLQQLKDGGRLILPLGNPFRYQNLTLVTKLAENYTVRQITGVLFVPMTGYAMDRSPSATDDAPR